MTSRWFVVGEDGPGASRLRAGLGALALASVALALPGCLGSSRFTAYVENDVWNGSDRQYTNGERLTWLWDDVAPQNGTVPDVPPPGGREETALSELIRSLDLGTTEGTTQWGFVIGQEFYTPDEIRYPERPLKGRTPKERAEYQRKSDRPFAGWLHVGGLWAKAREGEDGSWQGDSMNVWELDLGPTGPASLASRTQISFHHLNFIDSPRPQGWDRQVGTQLGVQLIREWRERIAADDVENGDSRPNWDVIARWGGALGNVNTRATAGIMARAGTWVPRDFGPNTIHSSAVDVTPAGMRAPPPLTFDVFAALDVNAVAYNVFLDGRFGGGDDDVDVEKVPIVAEGRIGASLYLGRGCRIVVTRVLRTEEFLRQDGRQDYTSLALVFGREF